MVEEIIRSGSPDYDKLEKISRDYFIELQRRTRYFSYLLFLLPFAIIIIGIDFFEYTIALVSAIAIYAGFVLFSVYVRYRTEKLYRNLDASYLYFLVHSDASLSTLRISAIIMVVLFFVYLQTLNLSDQMQLFVTMIVLISVVLMLNLFSPRFLRYSRSASKVSPEIMERMKVIEDSVELPNYIIHLVPERKLKVANAYCTGLFRNKIFITDYLLDNLTPDESVSILSHELGHAYYRHNLKSTLLTFSLLFLSAVLFYSFLYVSSVLVANILSILGILTFLVGIPLLVPSVRRIYEVQADLFSSRFVDEVTAVSALKKTNYLNMMPSNISGGATHPSLPVRIRYIEGQAKQ